MQAMDAATARALMDMIAAIRAKVESCVSAQDAVLAAARETLVKHWCITYNGDGYLDNCVTEVGERGSQNPGPRR